MTPKDYLSFRDSLGQSSGFQSFQYRIIEFSIGNKNKAMVNAHKDHPDRFTSVNEALQSPSLYDVTLKLLSRRGFEIPAEYLERDWS